MLRAGLSILLLLLALPSHAQDYEREKRWADEILPALVVGDAVWLEGLGGRKFLGLFTEMKGAPAAVLLVHGIGVHPDHGVIGSLRLSLADAGFTTLSIQMPVQRADAGATDYFPAAFPDAVERIRSAGHWLGAKGYRRVILLSHSMGSWMSNVYYEQTPAAPFSAWVCLGLTGGYGSLRNVHVPMLDGYGEKDLPSVLRADWRRRLAIGSVPGSRQEMIAGADHFYTGKEKELTRVVDDFIRSALLREAK